MYLLYSCSYTARHITHIQSIDLSLLLNYLHLRFSKCYFPCVNSFMCVYTPSPLYM